MRLKNSPKASPEWARGVGEGHLGYAGSAKPTWEGVASCEAAAASCAAVAASCEAVAASSEAVAASSEAAGASCVAAAAFCAVAAAWRSASWQTQSPPPCSPRPSPRLRLLLFARLGRLSDWRRPSAPRPRPWSGEPPVSRQSAQTRIHCPARQPASPVVHLIRTWRRQVVVSARAGAYPCGAFIAGQLLCQSHRLFVLAYERRDTGGQRRHRQRGERDAAPHVRTRKLFGPRALRFQYEPLTVCRSLNLNCVSKTVDLCGARPICQGTIRLLLPAAMQAHISTLQLNLCDAAPSRRRSRVRRLLKSSRRGRGHLAHSRQDHAFDKLQSFEEMPIILVTMQPWQISKNDGTAPLRAAGTALPARRSARRCTTPPLRW